MANPQQVVQSLLTEHLKYAPLSLIDDIINSVNNLIYRAVTAVEEGLTSADPRSLGWEDAAETAEQESERDNESGGVRPASRVEIETGVHQLETLLQATVDKNFDKLEIFVLRNVLSVDEALAPWVRLGHYKTLDLTQSNHDPNLPQPTPESLLLLRRKLIETRRLNAALVAERTRNEAFITHLRNLLNSTTSPGSLGFVPAAPGAQSMGVSFTPSDNTPLTTHTREALKQLPALKKLLASLRPKAEEGALQYTRRNPAGDERREYIETQVRRQFERDAAELRMELGTRLGPRQGQAAAGRKVGADEVRALEGVAGMMRGRGGDETMDEGR